MQKIHLNHKHAHTLQQIFQHPPSHNLEWHDVIGLIKEIGTVQESNGHLTFTLHGLSEEFHPTHDKKDVTDVDQVMRLRHFLERAGIAHDGTITFAVEGISEHDEHAHNQGRVNAEQNRDAEQ